MLDPKHEPHIKQAPKGTRRHRVSAAAAVLKDSSSRMGGSHLGSQRLLPGNEGVGGRQAQLRDTKQSSRTYSRDDDYEPPAGGQLLDNSQVLAQGLGVRDKVRRHG